VPRQLSNVTSWKLGLPAMKLPIVSPASMGSLIGFPFRSGGRPRGGVDGESDILREPRNILQILIVRPGELQIYLGRADSVAEIKAKRGERIAIRCADVLENYIGVLRCEGLPVVYESPRVDAHIGGRVRDCRECLAARNPEAGAGNRRRSDTAHQARASRELAVAPKLQPIFRENRRRMRSRRDLRERGASADQEHGRKGPEHSGECSIKITLPLNSSLLAFQFAGRPGSEALNR
jgi:hypothetical protein